VRPFDPPATTYGPGHRGVDLAAESGQPVRSAMSGEVAFAGVVAGVGWITVDHGGGLETTYGDVAPREVSTGDAVRAGQVLGRLAADASHLDWGASLRDDYLDPLGLLGGWRVHLVAEKPELGSAGRGPGARPPSRSGAPRPRPATTVGGAQPTGTGSGAESGLRWPLAGTVTSGFGARRHPIRGGVRMHTGLDLAAGSGAVIRAAAGGTVVGAGWRGGYGLMVTIDHGGGLTTRYAHTQRALVAPGMRVAAGQPIAAVGQTGTATGPHLHFEVRRNQRPVDPLGPLPATS
jgi:murein DD-endopeptidase MepM/ murein hydrolase activator NlpD